MVEIKEYEEKYAEEISKIIISNMYEINIKEHGKEVIDKLAKNFTTEEIINRFPEREKVYVAIEDNKVLGTASINKFRGDTTGNKYIILTVFVKIENHHQGIGKKLIKEIEKYAISIGAKEVIIPSSIYGCEFYRKLGFDYYNNDKSLNEDKEYTWLVKSLID